MKILFVFLCIFHIYTKALADSPQTRIFVESTEQTIDVPTSNAQVQKKSHNIVMPLPNMIIEDVLEDEVYNRDTENLKDSINEDFIEQDTPQDSILSNDFPDDLNLYPPVSSNPLVKNVYLEMLTPLVETMYVNEIIALELKMLIFSQYSTISTEFIIEDSNLQNSIEVLNPNENWTLNVEDSSLRNTFYFKIKQPQFAIPTIKVHINTKEGEVVESLAGSVGRAIKLERKGVYSQVLAQDLQILDTKITNYDSTQNLVVFQLQSLMGNLFDFNLMDYKQQGIESKSGDYKQAEAFYYVIVPKTQNIITFDYFNTYTSKYQTLQILNIASEDRVSTQSDIKPKNHYQLFKISFLVFFALLFFSLYMYKRKMIFVLLGVFALLGLLYFLTLKSEVILKSNAVLRIQPTFNSTIVFTTQEATKAEILGVRNNYYKVILDDERIGWVTEDAIQD